MSTPHIFTIRGQRVMLDFQLAELYGMEVRQLNQSVKRNIERFDEDFMFQLNSNELASIRSQFVIGYELTSLKHMTTTPYAFTELGIAMLSSVLRSPEAIEVNKGIMRTFFKMRAYLMLGHVDQTQRLDKLEKESLEIRQTFGEVFERLDRVESDQTPRAPLRRKKIGLK